MNAIQTIDDIAIVIIKELLGDDGKIDITDIGRITSNVIIYIERYNLMGMSKKKIVLHVLEKIGEKFIDQENFEDYKKFVTIVAPTLIDSIISLTKTPEFVQIKSKFCGKGKRKAKLKQKI